MNATKAHSSSSLLLRIAKLPWITRRNFLRTPSSRSVEQSKSESSSVSSSVKQEQDDEDPPFALLSRRSLRLLKIVVTTAAGVACVMADYSEITEEHIFSGIQRKVKSAWREMWSINKQKRLELENKGKLTQNSSASCETPTDIAPESS